MSSLRPTRVWVIAIALAATLIHASATWADDADADEVVPRASGLWVLPLERVVLGTTLFEESARPYSTSAHPRNLVGEIALSCEDRHGQPCGDGIGGYGQVDSAAGWGTWLVARARVRLQGGYDDHVAVERLDLRGSYGPLAAQIGRDTLSFGVSRHTQLGWGENAPPLDHLRISTARPISLTSQLRASAQYVVGRLRAPQTYPGDLVSVVHGQLDISSTAEVGVIQLLQLGGEGAPRLDFLDFLAEHVRRRDSTASATDSSNRRFGGDAAVRIDSLHRARFYYSLMFEDIRRARLIDAIRYDADHLLGVEVPGLGPDGKGSVVVEWYETGIRSQEHIPRVTGFTNAGYAVGAPLGPDAESLYASASFQVRSVMVSPWFELARLSSDSYEIIPYGPINRVAGGEDEGRYRLGARFSVTLSHGISLLAETMLEHVDDFAFESGVTRNNGGMILNVVWQPSYVIATDNEPDRDAIPLQ